MLTIPLPPGLDDALPDVAIDDPSEAARQYASEALLTLAMIARMGKTESARLAAANALLDRGYGKPRVTVDQHTTLGIDAASVAEALRIARTTTVEGPPMILVNEVNPIEPTEQSCLFFQ